MFEERSREICCLPTVEILCYTLVLIIINARANDDDNGVSVAKNNYTH